jgi:hypothetical protein
MRRFFLTACAGLAFAATALAAVAGAADVEQKLSITIYNNDLALVQDARRLEVTAGRTRLEFKNVSAQIQPQTVALSGKGLGVVEQNFDYDLLTPAKMMEKAVGKQIRVLRTLPNGKEIAETATVLSVNDGVVLKIGDRIEVLRDDGIPTRVIFSSIPENLRASPTLSVTVDAAVAGPRDVALSYLTNGLGWRADYVTLFDEGRGMLQLQGWITLTNRSGTTYKNVKTQLVAGAPNSAMAETDSSEDSVAAAGTEDAEQESVGDYLLYTLPERVTIADNQTKQVGFLDLQNVKAVKKYEYRADGFSSQEHPAQADMVLEFSNKTKALPAGTLRVYMKDKSGEAKFIGENTVGHTPASSAIALKIGESFDVTVQPTLTSSEKISRWRTRNTMSYSFRNARNKPAVVELRQGGLWLGGKVEKESLPSRRINAGTLVWNVTIPAGGETVLTFTVDTGG